MRSASRWRRSCSRSCRRSDVVFAGSYSLNPLVVDTRRPEGLVLACAMGQRDTDRCGAHARSATCYFRGSRPAVEKNLGTMIRLPRPFDTTGLGSGFILVDAVADVADAGHLLCNRNGHLPQMEWTIFPDRCTVPDRSRRPRLRINCGSCRELHALRETCQRVFCGVRYHDRFNSASRVVGRMLIGKSSFEARFPESYNVTSCAERLAASEDRVPRYCIGHQSPCRMPISSA